MSEITNGMSGLEAREILNSVTTRPYTDWGLNTDIILGGEFEAPLVEALLITNLAEFDYDPLDNVSKFKATRPYSINFPIALPITSWYDDACVYIAKDAFKDNTVLLEAEFTYARIIGESSFEGSALTSISMPLLTEIPANAFKLCADLATVSFDGVTSLANNDAFYNCGITGITDINFPSLTTIVGNPFQYSSFLTEINSTSITTCDNFKHLSGLTSVTLPNLTTLNGPQAFWSCSSLTTIDIPIPVPLNGDAFRGCVDLVTLPDLDSAIITGRTNFEQCSSLTTINMDNCTQVLNDDYEDQNSYNFASCTSLTEIHFPILTVFQGDFNFAGCSSLAEISMDIITDLPGQLTFDNCSALTTIYMPQLSTTGFGFYNTFEGVGDNGTITVNTDISSDTNWVNVIEPYLDGKGWTITYFGAPDPDAQAYLDAVEAAGGTINETITDATNTLFESLKAEGLYSKILAFYPQLGATSNSNKLNAKLNASFDLQWNGGFTYTTGGSTANGTNGYANSNITFNDLSPTSFHILGYQNTSNTPTGSDEHMFGTIYDASGLVQLCTNNTGAAGNYIYRAGSGTTGNLASSGSTGLFMINKSSALADFWRNNSKLTTINSSTIAPTGNHPIYAWALNFNGSIYAGSYSNQRYSFLSFGQGLTDGEVGDLSTIINTFQTTLGRNTY